MRQQQRNRNRNSIKTSYIYRYKIKMTSPITVLLFQALENYNKVSKETPEKYTIPKALIYTIGTTIVATVLYKTIRRTHPHLLKKYPFLSVFIKPLDFIFGNYVSNKTLSTPLPFEEKYFKEYDEWNAQKENEEQTLSISEEEHRKECLENMYYSTVRETINDFYGDVIMCYDHETLSFAYYARTGNIPYKYLETISRKYMIETNAPRYIHVDIRNEYQKAKERTTTPKLVEKTPSTESTTDNNSVSDVSKTPDVFAKLKSYNTACNLHEKTTTTINDTNVKITQTPLSTVTQQTTYSVILRENSNRYSYRGKITDFDEHHKIFLAERRKKTTVATPSATPSETTSYAEFKKRISAL